MSSAWAAAGLSRAPRRPSAPARHVGRRPWLERLKIPSACGPRRLAACSAAGSACARPWPLDAATGRPFLPLDRARATVLLYQHSMTLYADAHRPTLVPLATAGAAEAPRRAAVPSGRTPGARASESRAHHTGGADREVPGRSPDAIFRSRWVPPTRAGRGHHPSSRPSERPAGSSNGAGSDPQSPGPVTGKHRGAPRRSRPAPRPWTEEPRWNRAESG
jgi:hypothetical protein